LPFDAFAESWQNQSDVCDAAQHGHRNRASSTPGAASRKLLMVIRGALLTCSPRREELPLEEQLALARADAVQQVQEARASCLSAQLHRLGERIRRVAGRVQAAHIRGLEIDLLERDHFIDAATARRLREDAERYIRGNAELMTLPCRKAGPLGEA
jgi:hypothetical protein